MSGVFLKIFSNIVNLICGSSDKPQEQQQPTPHKPSQQAPHKPHKQQQHGGHANGQPAQYPPSHAPSHPTSPKPQHQAPSPGRFHKYEDDNQKNQQNDHYRSLRDDANREGDAMARCFQESHEAYSRGDGAKAKELSNQGKEHQRQMEALNKKASDWIYVENNRDSEPGEIDLHGLYVKEAIAQTDLAIQQAKKRGDREVRLIVGKGLHSSGGSAKIKPAIEDLMQKHALTANVDPENAGVLVVEINGSGRGGVAPDEISRRLERDDEGCVLM